MRLTVTLTDQDRQLSDEDLLVKATRGVRQALAQVRPGIPEQHTHEGGEIRALGDLTDLVTVMYERRAERMLQDIAKVLIKDGPRG